VSAVRFILILVIALLLGISGSFGYLVYTIAWMDDLPLPQQPLTTRIYGLHGDLIAKRYLENRMNVPLSEISDYLLLATIAVEDRRFFEHSGFDPRGIGRALINNLINRQTVQGGSTITQQLAKNLYLTHERTVERKVNEAIYTIHLERTYSKQEILEKYLNTIYYGHSAYGIEAAAQTFFNKSANALTLAEASLLAGLPRGPYYYSPFLNNASARQRQKIVLDQMLSAGVISEAQKEAALSKELIFRSATIEEKYSYFLNHAINTELARYFNGDYSRINYGGYKVYTTLDSRLQNLAQKTIAALPQMRTDQDGKRQPQGALVALDPETGYVYAMVGGRDAEETKVNRALSLRSPGSSFKPFVYAAALESGFTAADKIACEPISLSEPGLTEAYEPTDYGGDFHHRELTIREALIKSCNIAAILTHVEIGREKTVAMARKLGISTPMNPYFSLPLGTEEVTLFELTTAFAPFANGGYRVRPILIRKVLDAQGNLVMENSPQKEKVLDENISFIITDILKGVLRDGGTASRVETILNRPAAGKSGTAQEKKNVHMVGYTPQLVAGLYIGDDFGQPLDATGGNLAAPLWAEFMEKAHQPWEIRNFIAPTGIVRVSLCPESMLLREPWCNGPVVDEYFVAGTEPSRLCSGEASSCRKPSPWWPWLPLQLQRP
jgi:1A family penicillin-binding protein